MDGFIGFVEAGLALLQMCDISRKFNCLSRLISLQAALFLSQDVAD